MMQSSNLLTDTQETFCKPSDIIYCITVEDIQIESMYRFGRNLTDEEMHVVKKRLEWGIGETLMITYPTIFDEIKSNEDKNDS